MDYPPLVHYETVDEYRKHFEDTYCVGPIITFDGIEVRFRKSDFDHCFYETVRHKDDTFSEKRAARIDWIQCSLQDYNSERYVGWDKKRKRYDRGRRVAIVRGNYVVVISIKSEKQAQFITAYVADTKNAKGEYSTIEKIRKGPKWQ